MNLTKMLSTRVTDSLYDMPREHTRKPLLRDCSPHSPERQHRMTYTAERSDFNPPPPRNQTNCRDESRNLVAPVTQVDVSKSLNNGITHSQDSYRSQEHSSGRFHSHYYEMHNQYHPGYYDHSHHPEYARWQGEGEQGSMTIGPFIEHPQKTNQVGVPDKVDHTYRDFSGISPSAEDLERYQNKKKEYNRQAKKTGSPEKKVSIKTEDSKGKVSKNRGRGNKSNETGENAFIGFMGTNFPARLHDLLSHERGISDIITWLPHGRSWIVLDKKKFLEKVAPSHFQVCQIVTSKFFLAFVSLYHAMSSEYDTFSRAISCCHCEDFQIRKFHTPSQRLGVQKNYPRSRHKLLLPRAILAGNAPLDPMDEKDDILRSW